MDSIAIHYILLLKGLPVVLSAPVTAGVWKGMQTGAHSEKLVMGFYDKIERKQRDKKQNKLCKSTFAESETLSQ